MGAGSNAVGFGGGFARGFANQYVRNQETKKREAREAEDRKFKMFQVQEPILRAQAEETGDYRMYQDLYFQTFPDLQKQFKKEGNPFETFAPLLKAAPKPTAGQIQMQKDQADAIAGGLGGPPELPSRQSVQPDVTPAGAIPDPRSMLFGSRMPTPEERTTRAEVATVQGKIAAARRLYQTGAFPSLQAAMAAVGLQGRYAGSAAVRYGGVVKGDQVPTTETDAYGRPMDASQYYRIQIHPDGELTYTPTVPAGGNLGVDREALSRELFGKPFASLTKEQAAQVGDAEEERARKMAFERGTGTGQAAFEKPIDVKTAQETGLPTGTRSSDVAGQTVQTKEQQETVESLGTLRDDLGRIQELLGILPQESSLAGVAPGAVLAARRRMNSDSGLKDADGKALSYRAAAAQLQANVDSMVNILARVRGQQRGAQTEKDAERAYNAVVQIQAGLRDPLGGDTQESAKARIKEAIDGLDRVLKNIRPQASPTNPPAKAAPAKTTPTGGTATTPQKSTPAAATVPGAVMRDGHLFINGVQID